MTSVGVRTVTRVAVLSLAAVALLPGVAGADHQVQHIEPAAPAVDRFAADVPRLVDDEWGITIGGFGGIVAQGPIERAPVVFVHGNVVDHADWYPVRDDFLAAGWTDQELWALSYNGMGNGSGSSPARANPQRDEDHAGQDNLPRGTNNDVNVPDLAAFVAMVQDYTGSRRVHLVGHSLGVTLVRKAMFLDPALAEDVVSVVAIAGANHGTSLCAPVVSRGTHMSCDEIDADTDWLAELNGPDGTRETYGATRWLTVYDGTGSGDVAFLGPTYARSPRLEGAEDLEYPGVDHNGLRMRADIVATYRGWIEAADDAAGGAGPFGEAESAADAGGASATIAPDRTDTDIGTVVTGSEVAAAGAGDRSLAATGGGTALSALALLGLAAFVFSRRG